jgi:hypothetical protein
MQGNRVEIIRLKLFGVVTNVRIDSNGRAIYLVDLEDKSATPDGFYIARREEMRKA